MPPPQTPILNFDCVSYGLYQFQIYLIQKDYSLQTQMFPKIILIVDMLQEFY